MGLLDRLRRALAPVSEAPPISTRVGRVPAVVLAQLNQHELRVIVHPGEGQADGGVPYDIPLALVPPALRTPNTRLVLDLDRFGLPPTSVEAAELASGPRG